MSVMSGLTHNSVENTVEDMVVGEDNRSGTESQVDELTTKLATSFGEARTATEAQEPPVRVPRNERWATDAPEVNLQRTVESILSAVYQRVDSRTIFSSTTDVRHVDWRCPGKLMCQGVEVECSTDVILHDVIPNAPFGALKFSSPYELARLLSVLTQSHVPEAWRTARLLDRSYDLIAPSGLGMALSFYQQHCIHATLSSVAEAGNVALAHPPRSRWDPTNMAVVTDMARSYASSYPWTDSSWKNLKLRKNLIILPAGFENVLDCFKSELQRAVIMKKPEDMEPDWFTDDYSSVLLFSPAEFAGTSRWRGAWTLLMQLVAKGTEVIALAGPQNDSQWKRSVDMLRDLFEETLYQRPSLKNRLRCLLPLRSQQETVGAGFSTVTYEDGKIFTQSAAKRFWMTTMAQYASLLKFTPFKRMDERRTGGVPNIQGYQQKVAPWKGQHRRGGHHPKTGGRTPQETMPLQRIGNKMFKLVPVQEHRYAGQPGPRGRGRRGSNPHRRF